MELPLTGTYFNDVTITSCICAFLFAAGKTPISKSFGGPEPSLGVGKEFAGASGITATVFALSQVANYIHNLVV